MAALVTRKRLLTALVVLIVLAVLVLVAWAVVAGPVTVFRILRYGDTNIDDFSHYPGRVLQPSDTPFTFPHTETEPQIPADVLPPGSEAETLDQFLAANDTIAFLIVQGETILYERYFQGHEPSSLSQLFSVSKSVTSALVGMAIEDGYIQSVDQPITDFVPELAQRGFAGVTLHHLLAMTSGSSYREADNPFGEHVIFNYTPRLEEKILSLETERPAGELFRYKSGDNALLALALDRALGAETITAYAQRRLWTPLGMRDRGVWTVDHAGDGLEKTWCCLATSGRDLAKIGALYLNHGNWHGQQLLAPDWVARSTQEAQVPAAVWPEEYAAIGWRNYGYQWWLASQEAGDYFALGKDGQFLYVNPETDLVIVRLGWSSGDLVTSQWIKMFQRIAVSAQIVVPSSQAQVWIGSGFRLE